MSVIGSTRLTLSEEQAMLLEVARSFCADKSPIAAVREQLTQPLGFASDTWEAMVSLGWMGIAIPESAGGSGLDCGALVPMFEAMGRTLLGTPLLATTLAGQLLLRAGGESQDAVLASLAMGSVATVALLESEDWCPGRFACHFTGEGKLAGQKIMVADAAAAGYFVVVTGTAQSPALAVVDAGDLRSDALSGHTLLDETRRAATVDFRDVLPLAVLEGPQVAAALRDYLLLGALLVAAEAAGSAAACLDLTVDYLNTRRQFGQLIGSYQALKHPAVDILNAIDASRSFIYHAGSVLGMGPFSRDAEVACRMAKAQATETLLQAGDRAVQFHGAMGFTYDCDAQLYLRRALWAQPQFGDARHHRQRLASLLLDAG